MTPILLIAVLSALFFGKLLVGDRILASGDPLLYFYPYWEVAAKAIRSGQIPLWNSELFMGAPFLANSQVGFFYPLNWFVWLLFPTPYAYSASVYIHALIGALGVYIATRTCLKFSRTSALLSATLFGLGGYLTAQIEHINQLQGMAWLPYFLLIGWRWRGITGWRNSGKQILSLSILFALQFFAGHMQAVLITLAFIFLWEMSLYFWERPRSANRELENKPHTPAAAKLLFSRLLPVIIGLVFGAILSSIQLIPTLELIGQSSRQGGLSAKEALSFSLHPLLLSRSLLPNYDNALFIEYVATLPVTGILLAVVGAWRGHRRSIMKTLLVVAIASMALSLGVFNPLNQLLVRLPFFNLFRVPARWLLLYAFAMSLLAGGGLEYLFDKGKQIGRSQVQQLNQPLLAGIVIVVSLIIWSLLAVPLSNYIRIGAEATATQPSPEALLLWLLELSCATLIIYLVAKGHFPKRVGLITLLGLAMTTLFGGTRSLPYNNPTTAEAYFDKRPPSLILQANNTCDATNNDCLPYQSRFLSLSDIFFDVGDQPEINTIYSGFLSEQAMYDLTIATKQKEIIAPNLPMVYGLASVDGFGGGLLPLQNYSDLTKVVLPEGERSTDGRLREYLSEFPDNRWLDLFNTRYILTDKVSDKWVSDVFFDMQLPTIVSQETGPVKIGHVQPLESTELWLLTDSNPGTVAVTFTDDVERSFQYQPAGNGLVKLIFSQAGIPVDIIVNPCGETSSPEIPCSDPWRLDSLALVDSRDGAFQPLLAGDYRLVHSGDVKIYENLDVLPRAFLVPEWISVANSSAALKEMLRADFRPGETATIKGFDLSPGEVSGEGVAQITMYESEHVSIDVQAANDKVLVLTDANYPGWIAKIDGERTPIFDADILFRGVFVPKGDHTIDFYFIPKTFSYGVILTVAGAVLFLSLAGRLVSTTGEAHKRKEEPVS